MILQRIFAFKNIINYIFGCAIKNHFGIIIIFSVIKSCKRVYCFFGISVVIRTLIIRLKKITITVNIEFYFFTAPHRKNQIINMHFMFSPSFMKIAYAIYS